jgi:hypothetical protein
LSISDPVGERRVARPLYPATNVRSEGVGDLLLEFLQERSHDAALELERSGVHRAGKSVFVPTGTALGARSRILNFDGLLLKETFD